MKVDLTALGLNKYEAQAFEALVRLGKAGASEIARDSQVPYGRIYDILEALVSKGLAKIIPEQYKKYAPGDPKKLEELLIKKQKELSTIKDNIQNLKKCYAETTEEAVVIAKGKQNFYSVTNNLPTSPDQRAIKYTVEWRPDWVRSQKKRNSSGRMVRNLVRVAPDTIENIKKWIESDPKSNMRKFSTDGIAADITDNFVWFALINSNTLVLIKDKAFIKMMKDLFDNTWNVSKKV